MISTVTRGSVPVASPCSPTDSLHNDYLLRALLSAFARSNFDECVGHFRAVEEPLLKFVRQLPMDAIIARFPASRQLLESIYFRLTISPSVTDGNSHVLSRDDVRLLHCIVAVKEVVNYIADAQERNEDERAKSHCYSLLTSIARLDASSVAMLRRYYCLLENSSATLGDNVLVCSPKSRPCTSWEALAAKLEHLRKSCKLCVEKLKTGGQSSGTRAVPSLIANAKATLMPGSATPSPTSAPLLIGDLTLRDVEDRLMLSVSTCPSLEDVVNIEMPAVRALCSRLRARMDADKRLLLLVNELRPRSRGGWTVSPSSGEKVRSMHERVKMADLLHRYKRAIGQALEWIAPGSLETLNSSQLSESLLSLSLTGDGSEIELTSPGVSKQTDYSVKSESIISSSVTESKSSSSLEAGPAKTPEGGKTEILSEAYRKSGVEFSGADDISLGDVRPSILVERFMALYTDQRVKLLDAMDDLRELDNLEPLKARLILSVLVVAFRQSVTKLSSVRQQALSLAGFKLPDATTDDFVASFLAALRRSCGSYPLDDVKKTVMDLVLEALSNFPRLAKLPALHAFVNESIRLSWCLSVQQPSFVISHSTAQLDPRLHERFYASTGQSDQIRSYIWPALCLGTESGPVICKAIVET